jgi:queuine tRNA-ribosyltransferase subunit QTRTD1
VEKQLTSTWEQNIDAFIQHAPVEKPRFIIGVSNFKHIVMAISKGFDILDDSWIEKESLDGQALFVTFGNSISKYIHQDEKNERVSKQGKLIYTFDLTPNGKRESKKYGLKPGSESSSITVSPVDVWKTDTNPLSQSCKCWTCTRPHSRAYIHHLLCVNDMLAYVMLQHHNLHQLHQFVADIKASIKDGSFEEKASEFLSK